jgi:3-phenylpropionate/trans-cinnamate dioxygenase ferredoxin reductase subunit
MTTLDEVAVVGASLGGLRAVQALRREGYGGRLIAIGEEAHRPYDRPPLSKEVLSGKWEPSRTALYRPEEDDALGVDWRLGQRASGLDLQRRRVLLDGGGEVPFDGLVVATGAQPRRLPGTPPLEGIFTLRNLEDCLAIRAALQASPRVVVIGAGFIGAEVAATCRGLGLEVTLVEALPVPLAAVLGREMGELVAAIHRDQGVDLRCGIGVKEFEGARRVEAVVLEDGTRLPADIVVVGVGVSPATGWLADSGLELANGIVCDAACRTTRAPFVVAVGDVARWQNPLYGESMRVEHWTNATEQADVAAANLLAGPAGSRPFTTAPFFWSDQYDRKIQFAGRSGPEDETAVVDGAVAERRFVMLYGREGRLRGVLGMNRPRLVMKYRAMIRDGVPFDEAVRGR